MPFIVSRESYVMTIDYLIIWLFYQLHAKFLFVIYYRRFLRDSGVLTYEGGRQ